MFFDFIFDGLIFDFVSEVGDWYVIVKWEGVIDFFEVDVFVWNNKFLGENCVRSWWEEGCVSLSGDLGKIDWRFFFLNEVIVVYNGYFGVLLSLVVSNGW